MDGCFRAYEDTHFKILEVRDHRRSGRMNGTESGHGKKEQLYVYQ